jgi:hypothetical protein
MDTEMAPRKPRKIKPLKVKDWHGLITDFSMAIINGTLAITKGKTDLNAAIDASISAFENLLGVASDIGWETPEEELLWKLVTRAMWRAIYKLAYESRSGFPLPKNADNKKKEKEIKQYIEKLVNNRELPIDGEFFIHPEQYALVSDAQGFIEDLLSELIGPTQASSLAKRLPEFFVYELHDEWRAKPDAYQALFDHFNGSPFMDASGRSGIRFMSRAFPAIHTAERVIHRVAAEKGRNAENALNWQYEQRHGERNSGKRA